MAGVYTINSGGALTLVNAACTVVFLHASATQSLQVLRCYLAQTGTTTIEMVPVQLSTQVSAFPTLTSATPRAHDGWSTSQIVGGTAGAAGTCGVNASAEGGGARTIRWEGAFQNTLGWEWKPNTEDEIWTLQANGASGFGVHIPAALTGRTGWRVSLTFREL